MYTRVSALIPKGIMQGLGRQFAYNHIQIDVRKFAGFLVLFSALLSIGIAANAFLFFAISPLVGFPVSFVGIIFTAYLLLKISSESKGKFVESILPDALQLIASNMKSGLTTEKSLFVAGRPEFGPLELELKNASKRIASGERMENALNGISEGINSSVLSKTMWLISRGIRSGGQIADLLFRLSDDLKSQQSLEEEANANISIYILLILFAAVFGAPVLFGISSFIVEVLTKQISTTPTIDVASLPTSSNFGLIKGFTGGRSDSAATTDFILTFSMVTLFITTIFSCITIGVINTGKEINGVKYIVPLVIAAFVVFFAVRALLVGVFGNLV